MAQPTLTDIFGQGATQNGTTLTILKSDLVDAGLTVNSSNSAESLLVAILKKASASLTSENRDSSIDQSVYVDVENQPSFATRINGNTTARYIRDTITIELDKAYNDTGIDPDDY
ncbi:hypothetical protein [Nostoc sp. TCL26-01]|uniref:hypothetical protein n=1 Tax=Nostoc sp. TCL26-01 TaxID=2576904 RepID=UPI0015BBEFD8|nr:hypothetical protein [Nostoc sp. TCL26-01]QLE59269.1 hypothetical protein FD725_04465 [Nostoc sp. TCL26-01]